MVYIYAPSANSYTKLCADIKIFHISNKMQLLRVAYHIFESNLIVNILYCRKITTHLFQEPGIFITGLLLILHNVERAIARFTTVQLLHTRVRSEGEIEVYTPPIM